MPLPPLLLALVLAAAAQDPPTAQAAADPALRSAVARFFAAQEAEDVDAYLALWSAHAQRPRPEMLKYVFDAGDDVYSEIEITRVTEAGDRARVRVSALRQRTEKPRIEGRAPGVRQLRMQVSLTFVREGGDWKLLREGPAADDLAASLFEASNAAERSRLAQAEPDLLNERLILAISRRAGEAAQIGNYPAAQAGYELMLEVARLAQDRKYEAEALQNLGNALYYRRNFPAALQAYEQRLEIERERGDDEGAAAALGGIATIRYTFAEYGTALLAYREALALQERLGDEAGMATTLVSTGNILYLQGDYDAAIGDYTRSRELHRKATSPAGEARALEGLGRVLLARGDYVRALDAFGGVLEEGRARGDHALQGNASLNMGDAHLRLGNVDEARATFERSRGHFETLKDAANVGRVWQAIALTDLVAGRFPLAEEGYRKSSASCGSASDRECVAGASVGLGFAQTAQDRFADAIASYRHAILEFSALKRTEPLARAQVGLSQALLGSGDPKAALQAAGEARHAAIGLANDDVLWRALVAEARALRQLQNREGALAAARAAVGALQHQVEAARVQPASPVPRDSAAVFATLAILQAESGDAAAAFESAERMRVHDLRISLSGAEREIARGMTDAEREEERSVAVELVTLHAQLARERALPRPDADRLDRLQRSIDAASARRSSQQERLFARLPDLRVWRGLMDPVVHTEAGAALGAPRSALLAFVVDDQDVLVLSARRAEAGVEFSAHVRPVSRRSLAERVAALLQPEALGDVAAWRKAAAAIVEIIPDPVLATMAGSPDLLVVPHEVLWRVPFDALPVGPEFLADTTRVRYTQSVSALLRVPPRPRPADTGPTLLVAAAPALHEGVRAQVAQTAPGWVLRSAESAAREAALVAGDPVPEGVTLLTGAEATETALRAALPFARVIHLALPFRVNGSSPLFSPILLAGPPAAAAALPPDPRNDAALDPREIFNLDLRADVAILSDRAALSMREAADDAAVVQWAWRAAGVSWMAVPRWDDELQTRILAGFHERVRNGEPPDEALRAAQRAVRRTDGRAAPGFWAGWLLIGIP